MELATISTTFRNTISKVKQRVIRLEFYAQRFFVVEEALGIFLMVILTYISQSKQKSVVESRIVHTEHKLNIVSQISETTKRRENNSSQGFWGGTLVAPYSKWRVRKPARLQQPQFQAWTRTVLPDLGVSSGGLGKLPYRLREPRDYLIREYK